ncbi:50S ribosomal protein L18 [Candidatus Woesearchaeota archaeon]|nr:50S ribosomal protein L18 [Candidatus Woesearchaeota archaeon]
MKNKRYAVQYRRQAEGRTDYRKRTKLLMSDLPRVVVRRTLKRIIIQVTVPEPKGDRVMLSVDSNELKKYGWKVGLNISTAYLTGLIAGKRALAKGVSGGVADLGNYSRVNGGRIYAALKGMVDSGLAIRHDPVVFPSDDRIRGMHIGSEFSAGFDSLKLKISGEKQK